MPRRRQTNHEVMNTQARGLPNGQTGDRIKRGKEEQRVKTQVLKERKNTAIKIERKTITEYFAIKPWVE